MQQVKENIRTHTKFQSEIVKRRQHFFKGLGTDGKVILKYIFEK
jgi:hypothetical protein